MPSVVIDKTEAGSTLVTSATVYLTMTFRRTPTPVTRKETIE